MYRFFKTHCLRTWDRGRGLLSLSIGIGISISVLEKMKFPTIRTVFKQYSSNTQHNITHNV